MSKKLLYCSFCERDTQHRDGRDFIRLGLDRKLFRWVCCDCERGKWYADVNPHDEKPLCKFYENDATNS